MKAPLALLLAAAASAFAACPEPPWEIDSRIPVAFLNVNLVAMTNGEVLPNQRVVIENGRIAGVGDVPLPDAAIAIDATGCYLMPGLADLHFHTEQGNRYMANDLFLFLANGVTTVRLMWGGSDALRLRALAAGPRLIVASPGMDGPGGRYSALEALIATPAQARAAVARYKREGYDYIKVYTSLELDAYRAIVEEAAAQEIQVVGHVPLAVDFWEALASRQHSVEHLRGFEIPAPAEEIAAALRDANVWSIPTLRVMHTTRDETPALELRPEMRYVSPRLREWFRDSRTYGTAKPSAEHLEKHRLAVRALRDAGARFALGTDSGFRYTLPGFSIFEELQMMADAGLTPYEVLRAATADAAECLGRRAETGTVETGMAADLLLLEANPLESVENVRRQAGVMIAGRWFSSAALRDRLEQIAAAYGN